MKRILEKRYLEKFKGAKRGISCQIKLEPEWTKSIMNKVLKKIEIVKFITTALKC